MEDKNTGVAKTYVLRPAVQADFPAIRGLIHAVNINPTGLDWRRFFIAVNPAGELVGCGQVKPHRDGSRELASIAVVPQMRGNGVARVIIERLLAEHTGVLYLTCRAHLGPFYSKFGFRIAKQRETPRYFRTLQRFAGALQRLGIMDESLLIMKRESN
jgi:N-acetylglutamate synthase-like GNAT family acetyltransferase